MIITRAAKGGPLTHLEMDGNFKDVDGRILDLEARLKLAEEKLGLPIVPQVYSDARARVDAANRVKTLPLMPGFDFYRDSINQPHAMLATQNELAWKFTCRQSDGNMAGVGTDRSELVGDFSITKINNTIPFKQKIWQAFSQRFSGTLSTDSSHFMVVNQWHGAQEAEDASLSPPLAFNFSGTSFRITKLWDNNVRQTNSTNTNFQGIYYDNSDPIPMDTWINWVLAITFDYNNPGVGSVEIWRNGKKIVDLTNTSVGFNDPRGPRLQFGVYRSKDYPGTFSAEYANMELSYESLYGRVFNPRPIPLFA